MGLDVELQDEFGVTLDSVGDPKNLLGPLLPTARYQDYPMLSSIDPYGNTVFNGIQMERFLEEWSRMSSALRSEEERVIFSAVEALARRCRDLVHLYIKFVGD